jgi:hypothetical protein
MPWQVVKINNATHELTLRHKDGEELNTVIPTEHRHSDEVKFDWIASETGVRDKIRARRIKPAVYIALVEAFIIVALICALAVKHGQ